MLYNGQSKTGSSSLPRMAFVHPVKSLKYSFLFRFRNSDSIILNPVKRTIPFSAYINMNVSSRIGVTNSIVRNIVQHFI